MTKYKILQKHDECIGCGACVSACPDNWEMAKDGKSKPKKTTIDQKELDYNDKAAKACPVQIINIEEVKQKK